MRSRRLREQGGEAAGGGVVGEGEVIGLQRSGGIRAEGVFEQVGHAVLVGVVCGTADGAVLAPEGEGGGSGWHVGDKAPRDNVAANEFAGGEAGAGRSDDAEVHGEIHAGVDGVIAVAFSAGFGGTDRAVTWAQAEDAGAGPIDGGVAVVDEVLAHVVIGRQDDGGHR